MSLCKKPMHSQGPILLAKDRDICDSDQLVEEYKLLREEMMSKTSQQDVDMTFSVTTVIAILSYSLASKDRYIIFAALLVTLMMLYKILSLRASIAKISAYMIVYLEPYLSIRWETVNYHISHKNGQEPKKEAEIFR